MESQNPIALAAELRVRAIDAEPVERADLLFLAAEYERMGSSPQPPPEDGDVTVCLPQ
jgi:hypothetical protein